MQTIFKPSNSEFINTYQFLSVCLHVINETGKFILELSKNRKQQKVKHKSIDDPVTQADLAGQELIVRSLNYFWPKLKIIGEENTLPEKKIQYDETKINLNLLPSNLFKNTEQSQQPIIEIPIKDCTVWVDPLDGTLCYTKNELDAVTTLIGLTYQGKPLLGLVAQHFSLLKKAPKQYDYENYQYKFQPTVFFSHAQSSQIYNSKFDIDQKNKFILNQFEPEISKQFNIKDRFIITTTKNHSNIQLENFIKSLNPTKTLQFGGCGRKILSVIKGESDLYFYSSPLTCRWDIAAGEALILSAGGILTQMNGQAYKYDYNSSMQNTNGIIAASSQSVLDYVLKKLQQQAKL